MISLLKNKKEPFAEYNVAQDTAAVDMNEIVKQLNPSKFLRKNDTYWTWWWI